MAMSSNGEGTENILCKTSILTISVVPITLYSPDNTKSAVVFLQVVLIDANAALIEETKKAVEDTKMVQHSANLLSNLSTSDTTLVIQSLGLYGAIGNLVDKLDSIKRVVDGFAQVSSSRYRRSFIVSYQGLASSLCERCLGSSICALPSKFQ